MIAFLLVLTAIIAYMMGSLNTTIIASHFVFHCDLFQYSRDNVGITRFLNRFGKKGAIILVGIEVLKTAIPVLLGGLLLGIVKHGDVGRAFAAFCVMLGTEFPIMFKFKGEQTLVAFAAGMLCLNIGVGVISIGVMAGLYFIFRYVSLAAIGSALFAYLFSIIAIDTKWVHKLVLCCAVLVIIEYRKNIVRLIKGTEPKFIYKKDVSYMFDEDY